MKFEISALIVAFHLSQIASAPVANEHNGMMWHNTMSREMPMREEMHSSQMGHEGHMERMWSGNNGMMMDQTMPMKTDDGSGMMKEGMMADDKMMMDDKMMKGEGMMGQGMMQGDGMMMSGENQGNM